VLLLSLLILSNKLKNFTQLTARVAVGFLTFLHGRFGKEGSFHAKFLAAASA
jgi:hypothetical protein